MWLLIQIGALEEAISYRIKRAKVSTFAGRTYLGLAEDSEASEVEDIGIVHEEEIGDPEGSDFTAARTVVGEIDAVEYLEVFAGCYRCKAKTIVDEEGDLECTKCGATMKKRRGHRKMAARVLIFDERSSSTPEHTVTVFDDHVEKLIETNGLLDSESGLKKKLLSAPRASYKIDNRNIVVSVEIV